jgi:uncharacterized protein
MIVGGFLEFLLGNTFPFVVFMSFGAFWLSLGATLQPTYNAYGAYAPAGSSSPAAGLGTVGFNASFGMFHIWSVQMEISNGDQRSSYCVWDCSAWCI